MVGSVGIDLVWARFETWLRGAAPLIAENLCPPADDRVLARSEADLCRALPEELETVLKIHNGGRAIFNGFDLLSAESIVKAYRRIGELDADGGRGWIPFAYSVGGDYLCIDMAPGPAGTAGQVFRWNHDDDHDPPMAPNLTAWLARVVTSAEAGDIVYDTDRAEFLPCNSSVGFATVFDAEPPMRFDAARSEVELRGLRSVALRSVESAGRLPDGCRIELVRAGAVVYDWDVDELRAAEDCATDFNVFIEEPAPWVMVGTGAVLRVSGRAPDDIMWVTLDSDDVAS